MQASEAKKLKEPETENRKQKQLLVEVQVAVLESPKRETKLRECRLCPRYA